MSTVAEPALENDSVAPVANVLPEKAKVSLPAVKADFGVGEFWKEDLPKPSVADKKEPTIDLKAEVPVENTKPVTIAEKLAAKTKPSAALDESEKAAASTDLPEEKLALDPKSSPKARENFENLRNISRDLRKNLASREQELTELKAKLSSSAPVSVDTGELEKLRSENKVMSDKLLLIDTKNHPTFQAQYVKPRVEALASAQELLKANGKEADLASLIDKPRGEIGKALQELLKDLPPLDQTEISQNVSSAWKLAQAEKAALANAREVNGAIKQSDAQTHIGAFEKTWVKLKPSIKDMLETVEIPANASVETKKGLEAYHNDVVAFETNARKLATGAATFESISEASIKATAYDLHMKHVLPRIGAEVNVMLEIIKAQKSELDGFKSRNPNKDIRATPGTNAPVNAERKTIEEAATDAWGSR